MDLSAPLNSTFPEAIGLPLIAPPSSAMRPFHRTVTAPLFQAILSQTRLTEVMLTEHSQSNALHSPLNDEAFSSLALAKRKKKTKEGTNGDDTDTVRGNTKYKALGGDDQITVRKSKNTVLGGKGNDIINAQNGRGKNILKGNGGDDELIGGGRDDVLVGGGGADLLVIADGKLNKGISTIKGFKQGDAIVIRDVKKADEFSDLKFKKDGKHTLIRVGKRDIALVQKITPKALKQRADDFVFGDEPITRPKPTIGIGDITITEGDTNGVLSITATLVGDVSTPVTVDYSTSDGTAIANSDYTSVSGTLTFAPGSLSQTFTIPILADTLAEATETFVVNLSNPSGLVVGNSQAQVTIIDDDTVNLSISDTSIVEGDTNSAVTFTVTLDDPAPTPVTVQYATANGTAIAGNDYISSSNTLTFAANTTSQTIPITIIGDNNEEEDETFVVNLSNPVGVNLTDTQATATIVNDERGRRRGKKLAKPSRQPELNFKIYETLADGQIIFDNDDSDEMGIFEGAIEGFFFSTQGFLPSDFLPVSNLKTTLEFNIGKLTANRSGNTITYLFSSNNLDVSAFRDDGSGDGELIQDEVIDGDAVRLTLDLDANDPDTPPVPDDFDPIKAVNDLTYIIDNYVFSYATEATAYAGSSVEDIVFSSDINICDPETECQDLNEPVVT